MALAYSYSWTCEACPLQAEGVIERCIAEWEAVRASVGRVSVAADSEVVAADPRVLRDPADDCDRFARLLAERDRLAADVAVLRDALRPFAGLGTGIPDNWNDNAPLGIEETPGGKSWRIRTLSLPLYSDCGYPPLVRNYRHAAATLSRTDHPTGLSPAEAAQPCPANPSSPAGSPSS